MQEHRISQMNQLADNFEESMFTTLGPTAVALTTLHDVRPGEVSTVHHALVKLQRLQPRRRTDGLHMLHCGLLGNDTQLLFSVVVDAPGRDHIAKILIGYQELLDPLWRQCEGYPHNGIEDPRGVGRFLREACEPFQLIWSGYPGATAEEVRKALDWMRKTMHFQIELAKTPKDRR